MKESKKLLSSKEAARYLAVSECSLRLSRHKGEIFKGVPAPKYLKLGRAVRYTIKNLNEWIESQHQFGNTAEAASGDKC